MKPEFPHYIDSTMLGTAKACYKKFYWTFIRRRVPHARSIHLHAGGAFAKGCEVVRLKRYAEGLSWKDAIDAGQLAMFEAWGKQEVDTANTGKTLPNMLLLLEEYFHEWDVRGKSEFVPAIRNNGKPCVEFSFSIPLEGTAHPVTGEHILYVGRLDMLAQKRNGGGMLWATDEKTTKAIGPKWGTQWELRGQFIGYVWATQVYGYETMGALIRGVKITDTGNTGFAEVPIPVRPHVIERWHKETVRTVNTLVEMWKEDDYPYDFSDGCSAYGGCPYQMVCGAKHPDNWLEANYVENTWNPITGEGTLDDKLRVYDKPSEIIL